MTTHQAAAAAVKQHLFLWREKMDWEAISKIGTANLAIAVIGFILYEQTQALHALAENISVLVKVYSGHLSPISTN